MSEATYDELAGVVDLFGALSREELRTALDELAFKRGRETDDDALAAAISEAIEGYYLVAYEVTDEDAVETEDAAGAGDATGTPPDELLTVGPVAFPTLPPRAEDLPHILSYPVRSVPRDELATQVEGRLRTDAARAVNADATGEMARLLDVTYDLEAWADVDVASVRERLDDALGEGQA